MNKRINNSNSSNKEIPLIFSLSNDILSKKIKNGLNPLYINLNIYNADY